MTRNVEKDRLRYINETYPEQKRRAREAYKAITDPNTRVIILERHFI